jgi:hypothetical protein
VTSSNHHIFIIAQLHGWHHDIDHMNSLRAKPKLLAWLIHSWWIISYHLIN